MNLGGDAAAAAAAAAASAAAAATAVAIAASAVSRGELLLPGQGLPHEAMEALRGHLEELLFSSTPGLARILFSQEEEEGAQEGEHRVEVASASAQPRASAEGSSGDSASRFGSSYAAAPQICVPRSVLHAPLLCALATGQLAEACSPALTPTPSAKLRALLAASQVLERAIRLGSEGSGQGVGADDMLPAQVWALVVGGPPNFIAMVMALQELVRAGVSGGGGQGAYVLTTWRVAAEYVGRECAALEAGAQL